MSRLRTSIIISMLAVACRAWACYWEGPFNVDNMVYRLVEDVSPYYHYADNHALKYPGCIDTESQNLKLWRKQTGTTVSDDRLRWMVYGSTTAELRACKEDVQKALGADAYRLLVIAKECEAMRDYLNDPWYYPLDNDPMLLDMEPYVKEAKAYDGKLASRYALQTLRMLVSLKRYDEAMDYWEVKDKSLPHDVTRDMAEREAARAYLCHGDTLKAARIYARHGDIRSLYRCGINPDKAWMLVYENDPNSPYFLHELQYFLVEHDNDARQKYYGDDYLLWKKDNQKQVDAVMAVTRRALRENKVKDRAMWHFVLAATLDIQGRGSEALEAVTRGQRECKKGTFMATSMRSLRMLIEARYCKYNSAYQARLYNDLCWLDMQGRKHMTPAIKSQYVPKPFVNWEGDTCDFDAPVVFPNTYYWNDVMCRVLTSTLAPRLMEQGYTADALLCNALGEYWITVQAYDKPDFPQNNIFITKTNYSNCLVNMADSCSGDDLAAAYKRICHPLKPIDKLVARRGQGNSDFWHDLIGTHYIAEQQYDKAARWLTGVSADYQRHMAVWQYCGRDPFNCNYGYRYAHADSPPETDYKLHFARKMASLKKTMNDASATADARGEAMILYGVGLRNQREGCWALSRYDDTSAYKFGINEAPEEEWLAAYYIDVSDCQQYVDRGLAMIKDRNLKAEYLYRFARNREVMELLADTKTANYLRAHCDMWRDYKK